jgi:hypothetical protein
MTDYHRDRRVTHLVCHVKRIQSLGKKQCGISVPALVERPFGQPCEVKQPEPRPSEDLEAQGTAPTVVKEERTVELNSHLLLGKRRSHWREHVHFAFTL